MWLECKMDMRSRRIGAGRGVVAENDGWEDFWMPGV
jgi:hypothetical protein